MAYRIRIDGTAQRQCKSMPDKLVRCKRSSPLFTFRLSKPKTLGFQMLIVIQPLKKYLTEHESETLSTCHDKFLASCQDAQRPLSKTASLPEGKCILLLYFVLLSTVYCPMAIHWASHSGLLLSPTSNVKPASVPDSRACDCIHVTPWWLVTSLRN